MTIQEYVEENYAEELREEGISRMNKLIPCLLAAKRQDDLLRATHDPEFRKKLFEEFGI